LTILDARSIAFLLGLLVSSCCFANKESLFGGLAPSLNFLLTEAAVADIFFSYAEAGTEVVMVQPVYDAITIDTIFILFK
jgi:hypothetical protein